MTSLSATQTPYSSAAKDVITSKITRLHYEEQRRRFLRNDDCDRLESENLSLYHILKARRRQETTTIPTLHDENGVPQTTMANILKNFKNYVQEKFGNIPIDGISLRRLLDNGHSTLPLDAAEAIDTPVTQEDLKCAERKGKPNGDPGGDGTSKELLQKDVGHNQM